jgi:hypothetical protein
VPGRVCEDLLLHLKVAPQVDNSATVGCRRLLVKLANCESGLVAGAVTSDPDPLEPPPEGRILVCCSRLASELTLEL